MHFFRRFSWYLSVFLFVLRTFYFFFIGSFTEIGGFLPLLVVFLLRAFVHPAQYTQCTTIPVLPSVNPDLSNCVLNGQWTMDNGQLRYFSSKNDLNNTTGTPQRRMVFVGRGEAKIQPEFSACGKWSIGFCASTSDTIIVNCQLSIVNSLSSNCSRKWNLIFDFQLGRNWTCRAA